MHRRVRFGLIAAPAIVASIIAFLAIGRRPSSAETAEVAHAKKFAAENERRSLRFSLDPKTNEELPKAALQGRVAAKNGRSISGAEVCAGQDELASCATTGADGRYAIEALAPGRWSVHASKQGYLTARSEPAGTRSEIELGAGAIESADFVLLEGGALLSGIVRDSGGGVIVGATIEEDSGTRGASDAKGAYALWVTPGYASLTVRAEGYAPELAYGTVPGELDVVLHPASTISGRVVASGSGTPIAGARVVTEWSGGDIDATTDAQGVFTLANVPPGEHRLSATAPGWYADQGDKIVVGRADTVRDIVLEATAAFTIHGALVRLPDRSPCTRGQVYVWSIDGRLDDELDTDIEGNYEVHGLPPATYEVTAHCERGDTGTTVDVVVAEADIEQNFELEEVAARLRGIVLGRGEQPRGNISLQIQHKDSYATLMLDAGSDGRFEVLLPELGVWRVQGVNRCSEEQTLMEIDVEVSDPPPVTISLSSLGGIRGKTVDADGNPIAVELVFIPSDVESPDGCVAPSVTTSGKDGRFSVDVSAAQWMIRGSDQTEAGAPIEMRTKRGAVDLVEVEAGEVSEVEVVFEARRGKISGRVVDSDGNPVPDAMVAATYAGVTEDEIGLEAAFLYDELDFEYGFEVTDENGRFTIKDIQEGIYGVGAKARQGGCGKKFPVQTSEEITIKLEAWTSIEGVVLAPSGTPVTQYSLNASSADDLRQLNVRSADGKFALRSLPPGRYELRVDSREGEGKKIVDARPGEAIKNLELLMSPKARLRGRILGDDGAPVAGASVQVSRAGNDDAEHIFDPPPVVTDEQGRFEIENAPLGVVWLSVSHHDYYIPMSEHSLRVGEVLELEIKAHRFGPEDIHGGFEGD